MNSLNVMHVWDQAGVACLYAKYHRREGHNIDIYKRKGFDPFGILKFYGEKELNLDGIDFLNFVTNASSSYDVIHIHSIPSLAPKIKKKYKNKKIILHYHGSDIRKKKIKEIKEFNKYADCILVATSDLLDYLPEAIYMPNPIDKEHFVFHRRDSNLAFSIFSDKTYPKKASEVLKKNGFNIEIEYVDRVHRPIQYSDMPDFIQNYGIYVDLRFVDIKNFDFRLIPAYSKTALECLASGLRILSPTLRFVNQFPETHNPLDVTKKILKIYQKLVFQN